MVLHPPVEPMLARARDDLPPAGALPGDLVFQPKWDGYRALLFTPSPAPGPVLLQTRRGSLIASRFPDLVRAASHLPDGLVLDGELVIWDGDQLSFESLQRRVASTGRNTARLAEELPAHFVAFDILQVHGQELLQAPYGERRTRLEALFAEQHLTNPFMLCPETTDVARAQDWFTNWTALPGIEGLVIRGSQQRYQPGARALIKVRRRNTTEAIVGAITGTPDHPRTLLLGRLDHVGILRHVGRSTPVRPDTARQLAEHLTPAAPGHAWEGVRFTASWGSRTALDVVLVEPDLVAEVVVDTAQERGTWRHPIRLARLRLDVTTADVPHFGAGATPAAG
ncbi:ATP-dependent DNA ligase [Streptomyces sp. SLBN-31]|uniref:ATP-dependent DNA ligase n=1 Tax=Streptomyces sp. SLBN-31 TaxID=2768444 RepID=UPI0011531C1D|nr:ATP-dependent DNA ligase [Streptomyces sp. SLBN-31]TQJ85265.1 ATP dependent DNA ligase-like protein [Streptomyces sp. SLBN-31]